MGGRRKSVSISFERPRIETYRATGDESPIDNTNLTNIDFAAIAQAAAMTEAALVQVRRGGSIVVNPSKSTIGSIVAKKYYLLTNDGVLWSIFELDKCLIQS